MGHSGREEDDTAYLAAPDLESVGHREGSSVGEHLMKLDLEARRVLFTSSFGDGEYRRATRSSNSDMSPANPSS